MSDSSREFRVHRGRRIQAEIDVPGDKSISHRSLMFAALSDGPCEISGFLPSEDCLATMSAVRKLGVEIEELETDKEGRPIKVLVRGCGGKFTAPEEDIDCGNSGTTMRLLSGLLAGQPFESRLVGDASLSRRPMRRVMEPLSQMGADISAEGETDCAPLRIRGKQLEGINYTLPMASAQVKSAILLSGIFAKGKTTVVEPTPTRDHTERMLQYYFGCKVVREGMRISTYAGQTLQARDFLVPGDISSAAFWLVAAAVQPDARLTVRNVGLNPTRAGIIQVLTRMGARISDTILSDGSGEPYGHVTVKGHNLHAINISGDIIPNIIDEIPIISVAAALAEGTTTIRGAEELRVKETDRISAVADNLEKMGVSVEQFYDGLDIVGGSELKGTRIPSYGDHRIAMSYAIAGLFAEGETVVEDVECVDTSYPGFGAELKKFMSSKISSGERTPVISSVFSREEMQERMKTVKKERRQDKVERKKQKEEKKWDDRIPDDEDEYNLSP